MALAFPPSADGGDPMTLDEVKSHVREDLVDVDNDAYLTTLITVARQYVEFFAQRSFLNTTWIETFDCFPEVFRPQRSPFVSVTSIQYVDTAGDTQTFSSDNYRLDTASEPGRITLAWGQSWPSIRSVTNAVTLTYKAGYGTSNSDVPLMYRHAIKWLVSHLYENRESEISGATIRTFDTQWKSLAGAGRIRVA